MTEDDTLDLTGKLLIAMPAIGDPRFDRSVVYMCAHSDDGAMGLIINKPTPEIDLRDLLKQLDIEPDDNLPRTAIYFGGPVEHGRGFVLHSADYASNESTLWVDRRIGMTATLDVLEDIAHVRGPDAALLALGYAGWGPGQLEGEIQDNGWLVCDASPDLVFGDEDTSKWQAALKSLGVDALLLSAEGGRA